MSSGEDVPAVRRRAVLAMLPVGLVAACSTAGGPGVDAPGSTGSSASSGVSSSTTTGSGMPCCAHDVPATLFLNRRWLRENPAVARDLVSDPLFAIGKHGTAHRPLSVTGRAAYGIRGTRPGVAAALPVLLDRGTRFVHLT